YYRVDGAVVVREFTELDGFLQHPITISEQGVDLGAVEVWTNTGADGRRASDTDDCEGWSQNTDSQNRVRVGISDRLEKDWSDAGLEVCFDARRHLYCFEQ
ncbi:MAG: hypothetical protein ACPHCJ_06800, partial [Oceanococcaceae bacterium]